MTKGTAGDDKRCTAKAKNSGQRCKRPSVKGKDKCKFHGGATPIKHGKYSKYKDAHPEIKKRIARYLKDRDEMLNIENSVAVLRAVSDLAMSKLAHIEDDMMAKERGEAMSLVELLVKTEKETVTAIEKLHKMMHGETHTIKIENIHRWMEQIVECINEEVPDERVRNKIADRIKSIRI